MTGATTNLYMGLADLQEMALVVHVLRPGDLFVDVGANVGSYSILASGVAGARTLAVEPVTGTFERLRDNIRLNDLEGLIAPVHAGVGRTVGVARYSVLHDTTNRVLHPEETEDAEQVPLTTLDDLLRTSEPCLMKIDVEGYEGEVLSGAALTLSRRTLKVIIIELAGHGRRFGHDEPALVRQLLDLGFRPYAYQCFDRTFAPLADVKADQGNTVFVRDLDWAIRRAQTAPTILVHDSTL
jgi:FkbM family methyltransferase